MPYLAGFEGCVFGKVKLQQPRNVCFVQKRRHFNLYSKLSVEFLLLPLWAAQDCEAEVNLRRSAA